MSSEPFRIDALPDEGIGRLASTCCHTSRILFLSRSGGLCTMICVWIICYDCMYNSGFLLGFCVWYYNKGENKCGMGRVVRCTLAARAWDRRSRE